MPAVDGRTRSTHEPALDGLRGVAILAVLAYHGRAPWLPGGFLGVSTFFTLSGFVITRLLLDEHDRDGRVDLRRFWGRRVRRLLPALVLTLVLVALIARFGVPPGSTVGLRGDMAAALGQVANWRFILDDRSYGRLFQSPSLVQHTWSLSIEAQLYLLLPVLLWAGLKRGWDRVQLALLTGALCLLSLAMTLAQAWPFEADRVYFGTDTRALELLAGTLLALLVRRVRTEGREATWAAAGVVAAGVTVACWAIIHTHDEVLSRGGLAVYAAVSVVVLIGLEVEGPLRQGLAWSPLVRLGEISYAVYLLHWPLFVWLSPARLGVPRWIAVVLASGLAITGAVLSGMLLEDPVRRAQGIGAARGRRAWSQAGALAAVALVAIVVVVPPSEAGLSDDAAQLEEVLADDARAPRPGAPRVAFFGDSTSLALAIGVGRWANRSGEIDMIEGSTEPGCGLLSEGTRLHHGEVEPLVPECRDRDQAFASRAQGLDLAVYMGGAWDVAEQTVPGAGDEYRSIGDPTLDAALDVAADEVADALTAGGATMVWVLVPHVEVGVVDGLSPLDPDSASDPERIDAYNDIGRRLAAERPGQVVLLDLGAWLRQQPGGELDRALRPDGVHLSEEQAARVAARFVGPELVALASKP